MAESVYKIIELVGTSPESWEKAAAAAVKTAAKTLQDLRIAEVSDMDMIIDLRSPSNDSFPQRRPVNGHQSTNADLVFDNHSSNLRDLFQARIRAKKAKPVRADD